MSSSGSIETTPPEPEFLRFDDTAVAVVEHPSRKSFGVYVKLDGWYTYRADAERMAGFWRERLRGLSVRLRQAVWHVVDEGKASATFVDPGGGSKREACPMCGRWSVHVLSEDRFFHLDATSNFDCWLAIVQGRPRIGERLWDMLW